MIKKYTPKSKHIKKAEDILGLEFSVDYKKFLLTNNGFDDIIDKHGSLHEINHIILPFNENFKYNDSIIYSTLFLKKETNQPIPNNLYCIEDMDEFQILSDQYGYIYEYHHGNLKPIYKKLSAYFING